MQNLLPSSLFFLSWSDISPRKHSTGKRRKPPIHKPKPKVWFSTPLY
jgi:hypothetical protein